jgi:hypothetical protein
VTDTLNGRPWEDLDTSTKGSEIKPRDWVRFYRDGALVIGVVQYVRPDEIISSRIHVHTDVGTVWAASVLEVRRG